MTVGFWIILTLIFCGGLLVVVAGSQGPDGPGRAHRNEAPARRPSTRRRTATGPPAVETQPIPIRLVLPQSSAAASRDRPMPSIAGAEWDIRWGVHDVPEGNEDCVVVLVHWGDVFLAGEDLDEGLAAMDGLLETLTGAPALAVVGSIPNLHPAFAAATEAPDPTIIAATIDVWNRALADLTESYEAEFVDLSRVSASICYGNHQRDQAVATVEFMVEDLVRALEPALHRAVERISSARRKSG